MAKLPAAASAAKLQEGRREMAERCQAVARKYTPPDVTVEYHSRLSGLAWVKDRKIRVPRPTTRRRLHIYLHEIGHIVHGHTRKKPRHVEEYEAEQYAFKMMRAEGIAVPRKSQQRAREYVGRKIKQAIARGARNIDSAARRFSRKTT